MREGTQSAPVLDRRAERRDTAEVLEADGVTAARSIQVDDVQRLCPIVNPALGRGQRVGVVDLALIELATGQPHRLAAENVDRRIERDDAHEGAATDVQIDAKFSSTLRPCKLD